MKNFLRNKSSKGNSEDADRSALFGKRATPQRRPSTDSTASRDSQLPPYTDPYANTGAAGQRPDPYMTKSQPRQPQPNGHSGGGSSYANDPYANSGPSQSSRRGAPALDPRLSSSTVTQREELFRGAQPDRRLEPVSSNNGPNDDRYRSEEHGDMQTQEEEDEEIEGIKQEMRFVKQESLSSTRNALRMANEAEEAGRSTLTKLGQQSESLANAENHIDVSQLANREAQIKARELKHLNRSMFAVQVNKPWGKNKRLEADELRVRQQFQDDRTAREDREQMRKDAERTFDANLKKHADAQGRGTTRQRVGLAERSKYQYNADEDDDEVEGEIDDNLDAIAAVTGRLKGLAMATNAEVDRQNRQLERMDQKGEKLGVDIHMNTHRLKKISERG